ncbi:hypothetical protein ACRALDRAFT_1064470, partial [Sodiomyces alcalophilus JCM 7366]|uniref:uncharacterized protein n=1 Tax=Sodiomyces alcalophilus JCM 7366 TaxID=591952 RepID=UPI0039B63E55
MDITVFPWGRDGNESRFRTGPDISIVFGDGNTEGGVWQPSDLLDSISIESRDGDHVGFDQRADLCIRSTDMHAQLQATLYLRIQLSRYPATI